MKKLLVMLGLSAVLSAHAQLFSPESFNGAAFGGIMGALLGGRHPGEAAAIGAGSGFLFGSLIHAARSDPYPYYTPYPASYYRYYYHHYPPANYVMALPPAVTQSSPIAQNTSSPVPQPIRNPSPPSPMSSANALFGR